MAELNDRVIAVTVRLKSLLISYFVRTTRQTYDFRENISNYIKLIRTNVPLISSTINPLTLRAEILINKLLDRKEIARALLPNLRKDTKEAIRFGLDHPSEREEATRRRRFDRWWTGRKWRPILVRIDVGDARKRERRSEHG